MSFFLTALFTFLVLATLLTVLHEYGHYLAGRLLGAKAETFSVGFGPELIGWTDKHGTRWKFGPLLMGGFVKFAGETHPKRGDPPNGFAALPRWRRAIIVFAGPFANILVCVAMLAGLYGFYGVTQLSPSVEYVDVGSNAQKAGLLPGDQIVSWNGQDFDGSQRILRHIKAHPGQPLELQIERSGGVIEIDAQIAREPYVDRWGNRVSLGVLGIGFVKTVAAEHNPIKLIALGARESVDLLVLQADTISQVIKGLRPLTEVSGPIRIAKAAGEQYESGWTPLLFFTAMLSIAIAFMNLLPIPGLDGSFLLLYACETIARKDISPGAFKVALRTGYVVLGGLMVFAFSNDFLVLFSGAT